MNRATLVAFLALAAATGAARAEDGSPYRLDARVDVPVSALSIALAIPGLLERPPARCLPDDCDPADVNAFDRAVIGNWSPGTRTAADWSLAALIALPPLLDAFDSGGDGWLTDGAIYVEAILVNLALTQLAKAAFERPAPFVYDESVPLSVRMGDMDAPRSFPSGHTSTAFTVAATGTVTYWLRNPDSPARWVVLGVSLVAASTIGVLKIEAGYHHWTDVIGGALLGGAVGVLVPLLHAR